MVPTKAYFVQGNACVLVVYYVFSMGNMISGSHCRMGHHTACPSTVAFKACKIDRENLFQYMKYTILTPCTWCSCIHVSNLNLFQNMLNKFTKIDMGSISCPNCTLQFVRFRVVSVLFHSKSSCSSSVLIAFFCNILSIFFLKYCSISLIVWQV